MKNPAPENPQTIALFTYSTKPRGSVIHTLELAQALHNLGHQVCVYALDKDGKGFDFPLLCKVQLVPAQPAPADIEHLLPQRIQELVDYLTGSPLTYDYYHAQDCLTANALAILKQRQQIPHFIRTVHHIEDYSSPYLQQCQDRSIREADLCFCVSDRWQKALHQEYKIHAPRVLNGINLQRFSPEPESRETQLRTQWNLQGSPIFLTIGGIEPRKNSLRLLQAFYQILQSHPRAQLIIAGGATLFDYQSYRDKFFTLAAKLELEIGSSLILPGVITDSDLPALYRLADAFLFPSLKEGWGMVVLEAIASGLPVITSNQPPLTEFLSEGQGLFVDPESPSEIAAAMAKVLQPDLAQSLVNRSQTVLSQYTWEASAQLHLDYYQQLR